MDASRDSTSRALADFLSVVGLIILLVAVLTEDDPGVTELGLGLTIAGGFARFR